MSILLATPASIRKEINEVYNTLDLWMESAAKVEGVDDIYLYLNDIPEPYLSETTKLADSLGIKWNYEDLGYVIDDRSHITRAAVPGLKPYERFVVVRNKVLEYALAHDYSYLFFVDSDILVRPDTAIHLMKRMVPPVAMCSTLVNVTAKIIYKRSTDGLTFPRGSWRYNIGNFIRSVRNNYSFQHIKYNNIHKDSIMKISLTGAAAILDLSYIKKYNLKYSPFPSGEDCDMCCKLINKGGRIAVDTSLQHEAFHIQHPKLRSNAIDYLNGGKVDYEFITMG